MNNTIVIDSRASDDSVKTLSDLGYKLIYIPSNKCFDNPICAHPDIFMTKIKDTWFVDRSVKELFIFCDDMYFCDRGTGDVTAIKYPNDCSFNCVSVGDSLICNKNITHSEILNFSEKNGMNIIHVNQGYTKCSTCKITENAIITEDTNIHNAAMKNGIDSLLIEKGFVRLDGYNYGFIGGAAGLIENNLLAVNGNINKHPNSKEILEFCSKHKVKVLNLNQNQLYDIGSILKL